MWANSLNRTHIEVRLHAFGRWEGPCSSHFHRGHLLSVRGVFFFLRKKKESLLHATRVVQGQFAGTSMTYMRGERKVLVNGSALG